MRQEHFFCWRLRDLIKLKDGVGLEATKNDIVENTRTWISLR